MPPKARKTKEMILNTALDLTRQSGFETVNARSVAGRLQCSTRPIFTCYENMEELKREFLAFAYEFYQQYVADFRKSVKVSPCLVLPLSYIGFAREETQLFKLLFISDMNLKMANARDFYEEIDNEKRAEEFAGLIGVDTERAKVVFLDLFLYAHGMAVLTATNKMALEQSDAKKLLANVVTALIRQEKPDWDAEMLRVR